MTLEHFNPLPFPMYMLLLLCISFLFVLFLYSLFFCLLIHQPLSQLIMPSFISACIYDTNMYSFMFLSAIISIRYLPDQPHESCLLGELGPERKHFPEVSSRSPSSLCKVLIRALTFLCLSSHLTQSRCFRVAYSHHHISNHLFSIFYTLL